MRLLALIIVLAAVILGFIALLRALFSISYGWIALIVIVLFLILTRNKSIL